MRRSLPLVALALLVLGLELTTESITLTLARMRTGLLSLLSGVAFHVPPGRFIVGIACLLSGVVLASLLVLAARERQAVAVVGRSCPRCGLDTHRVRRGRVRRIVAMVVGERLTRRKCDGCGWIGLSLKH